MLLSLGVVISAGLGLPGAGVWHTAVTWAQEQQQQAAGWVRDVGFVPQAVLCCHGSLTPLPVHVSPDLGRVI